MNVKERFDGSEFIIDILTQGCLINHNNFFADDISRVIFKCKTYVDIVYLTQEQFFDIYEKNNTIKRLYEVEQLRIISNVNALPLDYTLNPYEVIRKKLKFEMFKS